MNDFINHTPFANPDNPQAAAQRLEGRYPRKYLHWAEQAIAGQKPYTQWRDPVLFGHALDMRWMSHWDRVSMPWFTEAEQRVLAEGAELLLEIYRQREDDHFRYSPGFVYLIRAVTDNANWYKIGCTSKPAARLKTLSATKLPFELEITCLIPSDCMHDLEQELHQRFAGYRIRGEWFALTPEDVEYIRGLAA